MSEFYYKYNGEIYTWVADGKELFTTAQVAVCYDDSIDTIVLKHGILESVKKDAKKYITTFLATENMKNTAFHIKIVIFPKHFDVEEINKCILNTSYLGIFLKKFSKYVEIKPALHLQVIK